MKHNLVRNVQQQDYKVVQSAEILSYKPIRGYEHLISHSLTNTL